MRQLNQIDSNLTNTLMVLAADLSGRLRLEATEAEIDVCTFVLSRIDDPRLEILLEIDGDEIKVVFDADAPWTLDEEYLIRGIAQATHVRIFSNWNSPTFRASLAQPVAVSGSDTEFAQ